MDSLAFQIRVPIRADYDTEIVTLSEVLLNAANQNRGKWACDVVNDKPYGKRPIHFETTRGHIGVVAQFICKG